MDIESVPIITTILINKNNLNTGVMNGWNTKQSWELAMAIDNTEVIYREAWIICEDYRQGTTTLMEAIHELYEFLLAFGVDIAFGYADIQEYILSHEE